MGLRGLVAEWSHPMQVSLNFKYDYTYDFA